MIIKSNEKLIITIPNYPRTYGNTRPKYFEKRGDREGVFSITSGKLQRPLPKKYQNGNYYWMVHKNKVFLFEKGTGERVISNPGKAGKPKIIRGQDYTSCNLGFGARNSIFNTIKNYSKGFLKGISPVKESMYPLRVDIILYDSITNPFDNKVWHDQEWDESNLTPIYKKTLLDLLVNRDSKGNKVYKELDHIIINDDRLYVTKSLCYWRPLEDEKDERYIEIRISQDHDKYVLNNMLLNQYYPLQGNIVSRKKEEKMPKPVKLGAINFKLGE